MMARVTTWGLVLEPLHPSLDGNYINGYDINMDLSKKLGLYKTSL
jgi:hypothetical protein